MAREAESGIRRALARQPPFKSASAGAPPPRALRMTRSRAHAEPRARAAAGRRMQAGARDVPSQPRRVRGERLHALRRRGDADVTRRRRPRRPPFSLPAAATSADARSRQLRAVSALPLSPRPPHPTRATPPCRPVTPRAPRGPHASARAAMDAMMRYASWDTTGWRAQHSHSDESCFLATQNWRPQRSAHTLILSALSVSEARAHTIYIILCREQSSRRVEQ